MDVTIGITSFNRFNYLSSLLESLSLCLPSNINFQIIVADNSSTESRLVDFIGSPGLYEEKLRPHQLDIITCIPEHWTEAEYLARNAILEHAQGEYLMFLQDDLQCIVKGLFIEDQIKLLDNWECSIILLTAVRKCTIARKLHNPIQHTLEQTSIWETFHPHFPTMGFAKKEIYDKVGPYKTPQRIWGLNGELNYSERVQETFPAKCNFMAHIPSFAGVWNDPRGHYSFIRDGMRYGHYLPAQQPENLYYKILDPHTLSELHNQPSPAGFFEVAFPIGWDYAKDKDGDQFKYPQERIQQEGPFEKL